LRFRPRCPLACEFNLLACGRSQVVRTHDLHARTVLHAVQTVVPIVVRSAEAANNAGSLCSCRFGNLVAAYSAVVLCSTRRIRLFMVSRRARGLAIHLRDGTLPHSCRSQRQCKHQSREAGSHTFVRCRSTANREQFPTSSSALRERRRSSPRRHRQSPSSRFLPRPRR